MQTYILASALDWVMTVCYLNYNFFIQNIWLFIYLFLVWVHVLDFPECLVPEPETICSTAPPEWQNNFWKKTYINTELGNWFRYVIY